MKRKSGKNRQKKKIPLKGFSAVKEMIKREPKRALAFGSAVIGVILLVLLVLFLTRPKLLWYVDEDYSASWNRILGANKPPFRRYEVVSRSGNDGFPPGRFGFIIGRGGPEGERIPDTPVLLYANLSRSREYAGWQMLALDPWMVFRKHQDPEPGRSFLENSGAPGSLLLAGADRGAVQAWLCQLLQERPGVFARGSEQWEEKGRSLVRDHPFQNGALTYSWVQVWPLMMRDETVWLYAPLSQARSLPPYRAGVLDASRFPEPEGWERYGMQADILWAGIHGNEKQRKKIAAVENWLKAPGTQTLIADTIGWIPAHPSGTPYNTVSWESQMAWLRSSYIWQNVVDYD